MAKLSACNSWPHSALCAEGCVTATQDAIQAGDFCDLMMSNTQHIKNRRIMMLVST